MGANASTAVPVYASGEVLDAARLNLTNSGIPVFSGTATRDAAFGGAGEKTLAEGQVVYLEDTDALQYYSGTSFVAVATPIGVIQVKSTTKTDTFSMSSATFADVTGLSVSITPTSASNKIFVMVTMLTSNGATTLYARLRRGSTDIAIGDTAGSRTRVTGANFTSDPTAADQMAMSFLDSPATTSATTYSVQIASAGGAITMSVNQAATDTDAASRPRGVSTITVFEVTP